MVALFDVLDRHGVQYDKEEANKRYEILIKGLRRDPTFEAELKAYKQQSGGAEDKDAIPIPVRPSHDDFLGPQMRWVVEAMGSPYAQAVVRVLFTVLFFVSYLEKLPVFGGILSAVLDVMLAGGRILIKTVQKALPALFGIIPLPFMSLVGISLAAVFGMLLWPIVAIISFSRQEFTTAIEAFIRIVPPPLGDAIADAFLDANRTVYRLNEKRKKIVEDITAGLQAIVNTGKSVGSQAAQGAQTLMNRTKEAAQTAQQSPMAQNLMNRTKEAAQTVQQSPMAQNLMDQANQVRSRIPTVGGYRFSRKQRTKNKWKTLRKTQKK
jgi:hypothetical protein